MYLFSHVSNTGDKTSALYPHSSTFVYTSFSLPLCSLGFLVWGIESRSLCAVSVDSIPEVGVKLGLKRDVFLEISLRC